MSPPHRRAVLCTAGIAAATLAASSTVSIPLAAGSRGGTIRIVIDGAVSGLDELCRTAAAVPGAQYATGWIEGDALVACAGQVAPVLVRGWRPGAMAELATILEPLVSGSIDGLDKEGQVLLGQKLAARLRASAGGAIQILTPTPPMPSRISATVAGVFRLGAEKADGVVLYASAAMARRLLPGSLARTVVQAYVEPTVEADTVRDRLALVMPHGAALGIEEG